MVTFYSIWLVLVHNVLDVFNFLQLFVWSSTRFTHFWKIFRAGFRSFIILMKVLDWAFFNRKLLDFISLFCENHLLENNSLSNFTWSYSEFRKKVLGSINGFHDFSKSTWSVNSSFQLRNGRVTRGRRNQITFSPLYKKTYERDALTQDLL